MLRPSKLPAPAPVCRRLAGIGENGSMLRDMICADLAWAGIAGLDRTANEATVRGKAGEVQAAGSRAKVRGSRGGDVCRADVKRNAMQGALSPRSACDPPNCRPLPVPSAGAGYPHR